MHVEIMLDICSDFERGCCCSYEAELEAWEKLEAAATPPVLDKPPSNSGPSPPEHDPQEEYLRELKIEVRHLEISCLLNFQVQGAKAQILC